MPANIASSAPPIVKAPETASPSETDRIPCHNWPPAIAADASWRCTSGSATYFDAILKAYSPARNRSPATSNEFCDSISSRMRDNLRCASATSCSSCCESLFCSSPLVIGCGSEESCRSPPSFARDVERARLGLGAARCDSCRLCAFSDGLPSVSFDGTEHERPSAMSLASVNPSPSGTPREPASWVTEPRKDGVSGLGGGGDGGRASSKHFPRVTGIVSDFISSTGDGVCGGACGGWSLILRNISPAPCIKSRTQAIVDRSFTSTSALESPPDLRPKGSARIATNPCNIGQSLASIFFYRPQPLPFFFPARNHKMFMVKCAKHCSLSLRPRHC
jgi:hypothetical protein